MQHDTRVRIEAEAKRRGVDSSAAVAEAERIDGAAKRPAGDDGAGADSSGKPVVDRLLIGFLPFIRVRELRKEWLGLTEPLEDDDLTCGEFQLKYGGAGQSAVKAAE